MRKQMRERITKGMIAATLAASLVLSPSITWATEMPTEVSTEAPAEIEAEQQIAELPDSVEAVAETEQMAELPDSVETVEGTEQMTELPESSETVREIPAEVETTDASSTTVNAAPVETETELETETETETVQPEQPVHKHNYVETVIRKATSKRAGLIRTVCKDCGRVWTGSDMQIAKPKTVTLYKTSYTYTGKQLKPKVKKIVDAYGSTINKKDYKVSYKNNKKVGTATVTITFIGDYYSGSMTKKFSIKPKKPTITSVTATEMGFTVKWKKQTTQVTGFQVEYNTSKNFYTSPASSFVDAGGRAKYQGKVLVTSNKKKQKTISNLCEYRKYYVRVRTYKTVKVNGKTKKIYSDWSKKKTVTTKSVALPAPVYLPDCPVPLYQIIYDEKGYPYFYGKWGGSANMDADNLARTDACSAEIGKYMNYKFGFGSYRGISWEYIGVYSGMEVVRRYAF